MKCVLLYGPNVLECYGARVDTEVLFEEKGTEDKYHAEITNF